jgi:subtilisin
MFLQAKNRRNLKAYQKIIVFKEPAIEKGDLSPLYKKFLWKHGAFQVRPLPLINGALCFFEQSVSFQTLAPGDEIISLESNLKVKLHPVFKRSKSLIFDQYQHQVIPWGITRIGADKAWSVSRGEGVKIGFLDTGIEISHQDLKDNCKGGVNLLSPPSPPFDDNGHGTHVAGIIAAVDNNFGVLGASPRVYLYAVKVLNYSGEGYFSDVISGLEWCVQNDIAIINLSFGSDQPSPALHTAIKKVVAAGKIIVAAAGNDGTYHSVDYPAAYPEVIAVGAVDEFDQVTPFTSRGTELNLVSPGVNILSTARKGFYKRMSGTSMAAAHVTGAAAILKRLFPADGYEEILKALQTTAEKLPGRSSDEQGAGLVRVDKIVSMNTRSIPA